MEAINELNFYFRMGFEEGARLWSVVPSEGTEYKDTGYGEPVIARNYAQAISHILINEANKVTKKGVTLGSTNIADNLKTSPNTAEVENSFKQNVRNAIAVLDTTDATQYPKYISDKEELEEQTGQKLLMDLNLGKIK